MINATLILILQGEIGCYWGSLYVDEHGEIDENRTRGKELFLSQVKLAELRKGVMDFSLRPICNKKRIPGYEDWRRF